MNGKHLLIRIVMSVFAVGSVVLMFWPGMSTTVPLPLHEIGAHNYVVTTDPHMPLPAGVQVGDRLQSAEQDRATRIALWTNGNPPVGTPLHLVLRRGDQRVDLTVHVVVDATGHGDATGRLITAVVVGSLLLLGLVTLWRGQDAAALGFCLFGLGLVCDSGLESPHYPLLVAFWLEMLHSAVLMLVALPGLFIAADALAGAGLRPRGRRLGRYAYAAAALGCWLLSTADHVVHIYLGWPESRLSATLLQLPIVLFIAWPLAVLALGYRRADAERRLRIRWVLWSTALLVLSVVVGQFGAYVPGTAVQIAVAVMQAASFCGFLYAVLRARLVDVSFVIDRALAYTVTTTIVIGAFALLENYVQQAAVGNSASLLLQGGTTLVLALVLRRIHETVEHWVDLLFFRRQRHVVAGLQQLARDCGYVEGYERLVDLVVGEVQRLVGGSGVAIYLRDGEVYRRAAAHGREFPPQVDRDDRALVAMRADGREAELQGRDSTLGDNGRLFVMAAHGVALGALACGARSGEQFAPDERAALGELARELAAAIYRLRSREQQRLLAAIAAGEMDAGTARQAARLVQADWQPLQA